MTLSSDVSLAARRECIGRMFCSAGKLPLIHQSLCEVPIHRSPARFFTIPDHVRAFRSPIHTYRDRIPCMETACLVTVLNGGA